MRVAVDAMGGDHAPEAPVAAAVAVASRSPGPDEVTVLLVGPTDRVGPLLGAGGEKAVARGTLELVQATEVIGPGEPPVAALRRKKDSTIVVGLGLVRDGKADAFVSAGSTGALMAGAFRDFGRIKGVPRPALATVFPSLGGEGRGVLFLDLGANADARPEHLVAQAVMGSVYAEAVLGRSRPRVGLLSNGTEPNKGSELVKATHRLLAETPSLNFVGNIEGRDVFSGVVDVVVTDGFTGNVVTKVVEGVVEGLFGVMREEFARSLRYKAGALLLRPAFRAVKHRLDWTEYGGAPFLGVAKACVKCHGSSNARAISSGIEVARRFVAGRVIQTISDLLSTLAASVSEEQEATPDREGAGPELD